MEEEWAIGPACALQTIPISAFFVVLPLNVGPAG